MHAKLPGFIAPMVDAIVPAAKAVYGRPGDFVDNAVREYTRLGAQKISTRSKIVELLERKGKVKVGPRYDLDKGVVDFLQGERAGRRVTQSSRLRSYVPPQSPRPINVVHRDHDDDASINRLNLPREGLVVVFPCEITGGEARSGPDTSEVGFFAEEELPAELSTRRVLLAQLKPHVRARATPGTPNQFRLRRGDCSGDRSPTHHPVLWQFGFCE